MNLAEKLAGEEGWWRGSGGLLAHVSHGSSRWEVGEEIWNVLAPGFKGGRRKELALV